MVFGRLVVRPSFKTVSHFTFQRNLQCVQCQTSTFVDRDTEDVQILIRITYLDTLVDSSSLFSYDKIYILFCMTCTITPLYLVISSCLGVVNVNMIYKVFQLCPVLCYKSWYWSDSSRRRSVTSSSTSLNSDQQSLQVVMFSSCNISENFTVRVRDRE